VPAEQVLLRNEMLIFGVRSLPVTRAGGIDMCTVLAL
jgi:hypothetical protein